MYIICFQDNLTRTSFITFLQSQSYMLLPCSSLKMTKYDIVIIEYLINLFPHVYIYIKIMSVLAIVLKTGQTLTAQTVTQYAVFLNTFWSVKLRFQYFGHSTHLFVNKLKEE